MIETQIERDEQTDATKDLAINELDLVVAQDEVSQVGQVEENGLIESDESIAAEVEFFDEARSEHRALVDGERLGLDRVDGVGGERQLGQTRHVAERVVLNGADAIAVET